MLKAGQGDEHGNVASQLASIRSTSGSGLKSVKVLLNGEEEQVYIDGALGPKVGAGDNDVMKTWILPGVTNCSKPAGPGGTAGVKKAWADMSSSEQEIWVILTAKKARALRALEKARQEKRMAAA
mmetsp:Transcript_18253/g.57432  ORF Transcript_18253/g.57432 Transcript_18253/m.57432 type:complete len:125 (+) Transcript_18253:73-447(+)